jgi:hypothetical protein
MNAVGLCGPSPAAKEAPSPGQRATGTGAFQNALRDRRHRHRAKIAAVTGA